MANELLPMIIQMPLFHSRMARDGSRLSSLITISFSLADKSCHTSECLDSKYFIATDMILVDGVGREGIEEVVADLLKENDFERYFALCDNHASSAG